MSQNRWIKRKVSLLHFLSETFDWSITHQGHCMCLLCIKTTQKTLNTMYIRGMLYTCCTSIKFSFQPKKSQKTKGIFLFYSSPTQHQTCTIDQLLQQTGEPHLQVLNGVNIPVMPPPSLSGHRQRRSAADSCFITPWLDGGSHVVREAVSQSDAAPLFPEQPEEVLIQALLYATIVPVGPLPTGNPVPVVTIPQRRSLRIEPTHGSRPRGEAASLTGWITRWMVSMFNLSWWAYK